MRRSDNHVMRSKVILIVFVLGLLAWGDVAVRGSTNALNYWVAPAATGAGDGSSSLSAAYYLNATFWSGVQSQLSNTNVCVNFLTGTYNTNDLVLQDMGNPLNRLTLQAVTPDGPVFSPGHTNILDFTGTQNLDVDGMVFTGSEPDWGIVCQPNGLKPCRNITLNNCQFLNLTSAYYGAIGLLNGTRDVQIDNCTFTNITNGGHAHMIYVSHDAMDIVVTNCVFQDCLADYVRFRDDSEYCVVDHCTFISTMSSSAWPFISAELYNDTDPGPGDEFFGNYFQITSNSFSYNVSGGPGPYAAFHFSDSGYSPQSYDCDLTPAQASQLGSGATSFKQSFLETNMGIISSGIKMFGNTYNSRVGDHVEYTHTWDDTNAPYGGWVGTENISDVPDSSGALPGPIPVIRNGDFDRRGQLLLAVSAGLKDYECLFRTWLCSPKYTDILSDPGFDGTSNCLRFDGTKSQCVYEWLSNPSPTWTMDCLFAIGSGFTGTGTKFQIDLFHNDLSGDKVSIGVDSSGQFGIYNNGTFNVLSQLGTVACSVDSNGNGNYTDPGDTLNVYHLRIVGNYSATIPHVDIYTSDANSPILDHSARGIFSWVGNGPVRGQSVPGTLVLYNYTVPVLVDQITFARGIPPTIANAVVQGNELILTGTNGSPGDTFYVLSSTNLALPEANWIRESTNTFTGINFSITNTIPSNTPQKFYGLQIQ